MADYDLLLLDAWAQLGKGQNQVTSGGPVGRNVSPPRNGYQHDYPGQSPRTMVPQQVQPQLLQHQAHQQVAIAAAATTTLSSPRPAVPQPIASQAQQQHQHQQNPQQQQQQQQQPQQSIQDFKFTHPAEIMQRLVETEAERTALSQKLAASEEEQMRLINQVQELQQKFDNLKSDLSSYEANQKVKEVIKEVVVEVPVERIQEVVVEKVVKVPNDVIVEKVTVVEIPKIIEKEIPKIIEIEKIVEKQVLVEVIKEVPVDRIVEIQVEKVVEKEVPVEVFIDRIIEKPIPVEVIVEKEIPVEKEIVKEVEVEVEKIVEVEVIKEVPVDKIIEVPVEVERLVEVPVEKYVEVPVVCVASTPSSGEKQKADVKKNGKENIVPTSSILKPTNPSADATSSVVKPDLSDAVSEPESDLLRTPIKPSESVATTKGLESPPAPAVALGVRSNVAPPTAFSQIVHSIKGSLQTTDRHTSPSRMHPTHTSHIVHPIHPPAPQVVPTLSALPINGGGSYGFSRQSPRDVSPVRKPPVAVQSVGGMGRTSPYRNGNGATSPFRNGATSPYLGNSGFGNSDRNQSPTRLPAVTAQMQYHNNSALALVQGSPKHYRQQEQQQQQQQQQQLQQQQHQSLSHISPPRGPSIVEQANALQLRIQDAQREYMSRVPQ